MAADERSPPRLRTADDSAAGPTPGWAEEGLDDAEIDARLVAAAQGGDRDAFRQIVERHQDRVFRLLRRMLRVDRDSAADLTQEVFLRTWRGLPGFDGQAKFTTWLYRIATNVGVSDVRARRTLKRGRWTFSIDQPIAGTDDMRIEPVGHERDPADRAHHDEIAVAVRAAIDELPDDFRAAVVLRDLEGLSYEEIGDLLQLPPGTVRSKIHRGRLLLQKRLAEFRPS